MKPLVSVIIPTFNRPLFLKDALQCLRAQTYPHFEAIVINDAGKDVGAVVDGFADERFIYLTHAKNKGLSAARNTGLKRAKGEIIAYLDDDDLFEPVHLQRIIESLDQVVYVNYWRVACLEKNGRIIRKKIGSHSPKLDQDHLLATTDTPPICIAHARSCLDKVGYFDESLKRYEDWDFYIRLSRHYTFRHIPEKTVLYTRKSSVADYAQMITASELQFLHARYIIHDRYREYVAGRSKVLKAQQKARNQAIGLILVELENRGAMQLLPDLEADLSNIVQSCRLHTRQDLLGVQTLLGKILFPFSESAALWRLYGKVSHWLGDFPQAELATRQSKRC